MPFGDMTKNVNFTQIKISGGQLSLTDELEPDF